MEDITTAYNYDTFIGEKVKRWLRFDESPTVGEPAPDFPLTTSNGQTVRLSEIWRKVAYTVIEFGSLTWPYCGMAASSMEQLAEELTPHKIASVFIYTHEAHPGENYPHHTSFDQKLRHAQAFRDTFEINRPILVDSLDGVCHRAYGSMPNMSWIIDRVGRFTKPTGPTPAASVRPSRNCWAWWNAGVGIVWCCHPSGWNDWSIGLVIARLF